MANYIKQGFDTYTFSDVIQDTRATALGGFAYARSRKDLINAFPDAEIPSVGGIAVDTIKSTTSVALGGIASIALIKMLKNIKMPPMA